MSTLFGRLRKRVAIASSIPKGTLVGARALAAGINSTTLRRYHTLQLPFRILFWTILIWGTAFSLPLLFPNLYSADLVTPSGITDLIVVGLHIPLATIPILTVWMWFPRATADFGKRLNTIAQVQYSLDIKRPWHFPASVAIVAVCIVPFLIGLANDEIVEWFEVTRPLGWGWVVLIAIVGVQAVPAVATLFRMLAFWGWFKKTVSQGLRLKLLSTDGCGGTGFIGSMISRLTIFAVVMGVWALYTLIGSAYRNNPGQSIVAIAPGLILNSVILLVAVQALAFTFLVLPTLITRRAMIKERDRILDNLSPWVESPEQSEPGQKFSILSQGIVIQRGFPTLPFTSGQVRLISAFSALPTYLGLVPAVIDLLRTFVAK